MELVYLDQDIVVCLKPAGVKSTDEPGGVPELVRQALRDPNANVRTVHRLDQVVSGLMVLARNAKSASELSRQIRDGEFGKAYLAVVHGTPAEKAGTFTDLLLRNKQERKTYVVHWPGKDVQEAVLDYTCMDCREGLSKVHITLRTGRTHQIRCQFSSRGLPLVGDRKYSLLEDGCPIALWSAQLRFTHPKTGELMEFYHDPPQYAPWDLFSDDLREM